jgi:membrane-bound serine protease (ClpP class)
MRPRRIVFAALAAIGVWLLVASTIVGQEGGQGPVYRLPTTGVVDNVMAGYIEESIKKADQNDAAAVVIELNTPGGSLDATQRIVSALLESPVPTIVWVTPAGGRAASAGTFITLAANLAYMAPGTNIGAASPVGAQGEDIEGTMGDKVRNDAIANITAIALARDRPVDWAVSTVEEAKSYPANEAVAAGAVDGMAASIDEVLALADGETIEVPSGEVTLALAGATAEELGMNPFQGLLHLLSDPNIAFILFTVGFYGLLFELQNPNFVTGILGALAIVLAFIGFGSLPLNLAGLILIGLAVILFILEFTVVSHGLLTVGGLVCFALGAFALYTEPGTPTAPDVRVALPLVAVMTTLTALFMAVAVVFVLHARREARFAGFGAGGTSTVPPGTEGEVKSPLAPTGSVYAVGEEWTARTADGSRLERGAPIAVVGQEGLTLIVEPLGSTGGSK